MRVKYLGIDYGAKRIGTAVSDADGMIAFPRGVLINDSQLHTELERIIHEERIQTLVVGDTCSHNDAENLVSKETELFVEKIKKIGIPIERVSEVWSSIEASRYAPKGEEHNDAAAAAIILQRFLDMNAKQ